MKNFHVVLKASTALAIFCSSQVAAAEMRIVIFAQADTSGERQRREKALPQEPSTSQPGNLPALQSPPAARTRDRVLSEEKVPPNEGAAPRVRTAPTSPPVANPGAPSISPPAPPPRPRDTGLPQTITPGDLPQTPARAAPDTVKPTPGLPSALPAPTTNSPPTVKIPDRDGDRLPAGVPDRQSPGGQTEQQKPPEPRRTPPPPTDAPSSKPVQSMPVPPLRTPAPPAKAEVPGQPSAAPSPAKPSILPPPSGATATQPTTPSNQAPASVGRQPAEPTPPPAASTGVGGSPPASVVPRRSPPAGLPAGTPTSPLTPPTMATPLPAAPDSTASPLPAGPPAASGLETFRGQRRQSEEGGRTIIREPDRVIIVDRNGQSFIRHNDADRFRYGAGSVRVDQVGIETRTVITRPDRTQIITVNANDGRLLRRIRRDANGREVIIIDNSFRGGAAGGGFYVDLPPPVLKIPQDRYIVEAETAEPALIYETLSAPPVERIIRRYTLDEVRYSPALRQRMPSIDVNTINFPTGSWEIPPDQAGKLQIIADALIKAVSRNAREVFLIEGHTDAVGSDVDNLSLSDRRAETTAILLSQQFGVPAENLATQGYGEQYLKIATEGEAAENRRVTVRRITPLLGQAPPAPARVVPPRQ